MSCHHPRGLSSVIACVFVLWQPSVAHAQTEPSLLPDLVVTAPREAVQAASIGDTHRAAELLEAAATSFVDPTNRVRGFGDAMRLAQGDLDMERRLVARLITEARSRSSAETQSLVRAYVEHYGRALERTVSSERNPLLQSDILRECHALYEDAAAALGDDAPVDVRIRALIARARVVRRLGDVRSGRDLTRRAIALYRTTYPDDPVTDDVVDDRDPWEIAQEQAIADRKRLLRIMHGRWFAPGGTAEWLPGTHPGIGRVYLTLYWEREETRCSAPLVGNSPESTRARACEAIAEGRMAFVLDDWHFMMQPLPGLPGSMTQEQCFEWVRAVHHRAWEAYSWRFYRVAYGLERVARTGANAWSPVVFATYAHLWRVVATRSGGRHPCRTEEEEARFQREQEDGRARYMSITEQHYNQMLPRAIRALSICVRSAAFAHDGRWLTFCDENRARINRGLYPAFEEVTPALQVHR
jgi:hypothetical protein